MPPKKPGFRNLIANFRFTIRCISAGVLASLLVTAFPALSQNTWNNAAGTTNWSDAGNWSFGASPSTFDIVLFDNVTPASPANVIDNIVDNNFTISALTYQTVSTNGFHTTWLNSGVSLNVNGTDGNAISVGSGGILAGAVSVYDRFAGPGTLTITNLSGAINASQGGDNNDHFATLDLSGLTNFSASVGPDPGRLYSRYLNPWHSPNGNYSAGRY